MKIKIPNKKDFFAGLLFIFFGGVFLQVAWGYPMGTTREMGPGYFPAILGGIMAFLGIVIAVHSLLWFNGETIQIKSLRPLLFVCAAVLAFAFTVGPLGLILGILEVVFVSRLGGWEFRLREAIVLSLVLAAIGAGLFVFALGLPFDLFGRR